MILPILQNTLINFCLCPSIFFSLPTQEFFRGQGKIEVGREKKLNPISCGLRFNFKL